MSFPIIFPPRISSESKEKNSTSFLLLLERRRVYIDGRGRQRADNNCKLTNCGCKEGRKRDRVGYGEGGRGVSTANGARLINEAIHLNDRAKAACSFHARNVGAVRRTRFRLYARRVYYWSRCTWPVCTHVVTWIYIYIYKPCWFRGDCFNRPTRFQSTPRYLNISSSRDIYMYIHFGLGYLSVLRSFGTFQRVSRRFNKNRINVLLSKWKGKISFIALYFVRNLAGRIL